MALLKAADDYVVDDFRAFEIDDGLLTKILAGEESISIKGGGASPVVMCTNSETFSLTSVETSNTILILEAAPNTAAAAEVVNVPGRITQHYEMSRIGAALHKVVQLLQERAYDGADGDQPGLTFDELLNGALGSRVELIKELEALQAFEHNGFWFVLDEEFQMRVLESILDLCEESSWDFQAVPSAEAADILSELYPPHITHHVLRVHSTLPKAGEESSESTNSAAGCVALDAVKVARSRARQVLLALNLADEERIDLETFMAAWSATVPKSLHGPEVMSTSTLSGLVLLEKAGVHVYIYSLFESSLSPDPAERFEQLFRRRARWELPDLRVFVQPLVCPGRNLDDMLLRYTRSSLLPDGSRLYSAR